MRAARFLRRSRRVRGYARGARGSGTLCAAGGAAARRRSHDSCRARRAGGRRRRERATREARRLTGRSPCELFLTSLPPSVRFNNDERRTSCVQLVARHRLEVQTQSELNLPARAEADGALDRLAQKAEGRARGRLRVALARLLPGAENESARRRIEGQRRQRDVQGRRGVGEVRVVEDVENLGAELKLHALGQGDALAER